MIHVLSLKPDMSPAISKDLVRVWAMDIAEKTVAIVSSDILVRSVTLCRLAVS